mmetsp:Transcript_73858/g.119864  ORF Transcript_73858/g.119864 Transcript_73858/m.119864 type:complete len:343 (-) Transcript_73858:1216-2244(-)
MRWSKAVAILSASCELPPPSLSLRSISRSRSICLTSPMSSSSRLLLAASCSLARFNFVSASLSVLSPRAMSWIFAISASSLLDCADTSSSRFSILSSNFVMSLTRLSVALSTKASTVSRTVAADPRSSFSSLAMTLSLLTTFSSRLASIFLSSRIASILDSSPWKAWSSASLPLTDCSLCCSALSRSDELSSKARCSSVAFSRAACNCFSRSFARVSCCSTSSFCARKAASCAFKAAAFAAKASWSAFVLAWCASFSRASSLTCKVLALDSKTRFKISFSSEVPASLSRSSLSCSLTLSSRTSSSMDRKDRCADRAACSTSDTAFVCALLRPCKCCTCCCMR